MKKENRYGVIMAGGIGSRFWPMSRTELPKQFIDVLGTGQTLMQSTFDRLKSFIPAENILIVTNSEYQSLVSEQLPNLPQANILLEPARRNTAPCIAYASFVIRQRNPEAVVVTAPSDHLILRPNEFVASVEQAMEFALEEDALVTLGITPSRPDTGYGYIQFEPSKKEVKPVKTFTEKPDLDWAKKFVESGDFLWNSGIFIWSIRSAMFAFQKYLNEMYQTFHEGAQAYGTSKEAEFIGEIYPKCRNVSIDYGLMEKADNVYVIPSDWGWSDLGTWGSLYTHVQKDEQKNAILGQNVLTYNSHRNMIANENSQKLIVLQDVDDVIVVDTEHALLICKKSQEQEIKQIVTNVKLEKGDRYI